MKGMLLLAGLAAAGACGEDEGDERVVATDEGDVEIDLSRTERLPGPCAGEAVGGSTGLRSCAFSYDGEDLWALDYSTSNGEEGTNQHLTITRSGGEITAIERSGSVGDGQCVEEEWTFRADGSTRVGVNAHCYDGFVEVRWTTEYASDALEPLEPLDCAYLVAARGKERVLSLVEDELGDGSADSSILYTYEGERGPGATVERVADFSWEDGEDGRDEIVTFSYDDDARLVEVTSDSTYAYVYEGERLVQIGDDELVYDDGGNLVARISGESEGPDATRVMVYDHSCWE